MRVTWIGAGILAMTMASGAAAQETAYDQFSRFCAESFGAEKEPLTYEKFGDKLLLLPDSSWTHASLRSACVAWATTLPARTVVEYGPTASLGQSTAPPDRHYYTHVHYLRDLKPNTTYHYRMAGVDERGRRWESPTRTFRTAVPATPKPITQLPPGHPYRITAPGYYLVAADLVADHSAIVIESGDVTVDLGGHTVTYNQQKMPPINSDDGNVWFDQAPHGVVLAKRNLQNVRVVNGTIVQGAGGDGAQANGRGANPVGAMSGCGGEMAGLTIRWHGEQVVGMCMLWNPPIDVHHNVLIDEGTAITNRHQGVSAIQTVPRPHHNLIARTRQRGIDAATDGGEVFRNEIYIDSMATNSTGIHGYKAKNLVVRDNRVFGGGYLAVGIGALSQGTANVKVLDNFVHLQAAAPSASWAEYGEQSGAYCFRVTWGGESILVENNTFVTRGRDGGMVRGVWYCPDPQQKGNVIRHNVIKAISDNAATDVRGAIVISGGEGPPGSSDGSPVLFEANRVISNFCHVLLGEPYGAGHSTRFVRNTFEREGDLDRFRFVQIGHGNQQCTDNAFIDSTFGKGVRPDMIRWEGHTDAPRWFDVTTGKTTIRFENGQAKPAR